jgi:hypothetical protein
LEGGETQAPERIAARTNRTTTVHKIDLLIELNLGGLENHRGRFVPRGFRMHLARTSYVLIGGPPACERGEKQEPGRRRAPPQPRLCRGRAGRQPRAAPQRPSKRLADLTDDALLAAASPGATLEDRDGRTVGRRPELPPLPSDQPLTKRELLTKRERELAERYRKSWPGLDSDSGSGRRD